MTSETILKILGIVLGSGAFFTFVQFLIQRNDAKKKNKSDKTNAIDKNVTELQTAMGDLSKAVKTLQESVNQNNENMALQNEALMAMAQDRIIYLAREFIKQKYIYEDDLNNLHRLADSYRDLHGNGEVKILMDLVDELEVRIR